MDEKPTLPDYSGSAMAMERVLEAERAAELALAESRRRAGEIIEAARLKSQDIAKRTDERIAALHTGHGEKVDREIEALRRQAQSRRSDETEAGWDRKTVAKAAARLAEKLTRT